MMMKCFQEENKSLDVLSNVHNNQGACNTMSPMLTTNRTVRKRKLFLDHFCVEQTPTQCSTKNLSDLSTNSVLKLVGSVGGRSVAFKFEGDPNICRGAGLSSP